MRPFALLLGAVCLAAAAPLQRAIEPARAAVPAHDAGTAFEPALRLAGVAFPSLAADLAWIRTVQHFATLGGLPDPSADRTLSALVDLTVTLDPDFVAGYRLGAVFLVEPPPRGPGQVDAAVRLLERGIEVHPGRWQLVFDLGFLRYRWRHEYDRAAAAFLRASRMPEAPWWLQPLAATVLAEGGRRHAARALWQAQRADSALPWMREQAAHRLAQLDALEGIDALQAVVDAARAAGAPGPYTWEALVDAGWLEARPLDPSGRPYAIAAATGRVGLSVRSPLAPLPKEGGFREP